MKIGLDFDDVIVMSQGIKSRSAKDLFGVDIQPKDFRREKVVGQNILTDEQYTQAVRRVYNGTYKLFPVPNALGTIKFLQKEGHSLKVVTNRSKEQDTLRYAEAWLKEQSLEIEITGVLYGNSKARACCGLDLFVDDDAEKITQLEGIVPHRLVFAWQFNEHLPTPLGAQRIESWPEILEYVRQVADL